MPPVPGIAAFVLIPEGKIALGKLAQAMMAGAIVLQIRGNFDAGMRLVKEVAARAPVTIVNSINPVPFAGTEDRGVRDHRSARAGAGFPLHTGR